MYLRAANRRANGWSLSAWFKGRLPSGAVLHSSREPGEPSQWLLQSHGDSTMNIDLILLLLLLLFTTSLGDVATRLRCGGILLVQINIFSAPVKEFLKSVSIFMKI